MTITLLRSTLYVPAANARAIEKASQLPADAVIFDLEDSVGPDEKPEARARVAQLAIWQKKSTQTRIVRINALGTPWGKDDLAMAAQIACDAILLPKLDAPDTLAEAAAQAGGKPLWAMVETPLTMLRLPEIAASAGQTQLQCLVLGSNDLARDMGFALGRAHTPLPTITAHLLLVAKAYQLSALDGVYNDIADAPGFGAAVKQAAQAGFDGKTLIHPSQIIPANDAFTPDAKALETARAVIAAFDAPDAQGKGVIKLDGRMVERLHYDMAQRLVARAEAMGM